LFAFENSAEDTDLPVALEAVFLKHWSQARSLQ
jgi:hypothetical protein